MRVLIVGCGYVGLPLAVELARQGHKVFGLRRSASADDDLKTAGVMPLRGDITKPETLTALPKDFDWVVNCAATGGGSVEDYRQLYLEGTRNLIEWLTPWSTSIPLALDESRQRDAGAPRFVYTSSTGVYGQTDGSVVTETSPTEPATDTARVLVETERLLITTVGERKFPAVILRTAGIYGPGRGYLLKQFLRGEARIEGKGDRVLNMIHRDDLIGVIVAALKNGRPGEIYNATDDEPVSQLDFFTWLAAKLGKPLPPTVPMNAESNRKRGITSKRVSNQKLKTELSYHFNYLNFRKGYAVELIRLARAGLLDIKVESRESI